MPNLLLKSPHILIIDDEPDNLNQLSELLSRRQAILYKARSGEQALKILDRTPIDVVISDWMLPGLSGIELVTHLRATGFKGPLVIFTGSMIEAGHLQQALDAGASDYLRKPLNHVEFDARLDKCLQLYAQQYALETFSDSQHKLMALMVEHLGGEIQRLSQIQELEELGADPGKLVPQRRESTQQLKERFQKLMAWSRYRFDLARIESFRFEVRQLFKSIEASCDDTGGRLRLRGGNGVWVVSNLELLLRVLSQLVDNALRHTSGEVTLRCTQHDKALSFEVLDEGDLSEGDLDRFENDQGTGLGLRICHDLLALLGSRLRADRRAQGGSRFSFDLPAEL